MRWVLILPQTIALKEFFRLCFWQEGPSVGLPVLEKWTWKSNKAKVARVCRVKCYREKTYRKISEKLQRECPLVFSWVLTSACMWKDHTRAGRMGNIQFSSVQFSHSVVSDSLWPHESQHARPPCTSPIPRVHSDSCPSSQWWPSSHLILCCPLLLLPPIPPSIRVFSNESTLRMRWPTYWSFQL